jgi:hypothetical protein
VTDGRTHAAPIEVRVENVSQLFNTLDPFPFQERDLDREAEEFIVGWARELPRDQPIRLIIHLPVEKISEQDREVAGALNRYFGYRQGIIERDINELFREGRISLVIGLTMLALCLIAAQFGARQLGDTSFGRFVQESLIILGWVANWKPIQIFLYDWWPLVRRRNLYQRLTQADVQLKHHP